MPRERSTWNVHQIAKRAGLKIADPYLMNQDHVNQQPSADEYVIGTPSDFAEDIHPATTTWEAEYANGQVKRNEIGMPEIRNDTFNHPEKTASEEVLTRKAALCVAIARRVLPKTASAIEVEDQSLSFMHLPDAEVMATYTRLAADQDQDQQGQQQQQQVQAAQQDQQQQGQQQQVQAAQQQDQQGQQQQQQVQAAQQQDQQGQGQQQDQQRQAGQIPPQFLENVKKKQEEAKEDKEQDKKAGQQQDQQQQGQQQVQAAQQDQQQQVQAAQQQDQQGQQQQGQEKQAQMQQQLAQLIQQAQQIQDQLAAQQQQQQAGQQQQQQQAGQQQQGGQQQQQQQQAGQQQQGGQQQQQQAQMQQQSQAQQVAQAVQQAIAQGQDPIQAAEQCMALYQQQQAGQQQQQSNDSQMIDDMLAAQGQQQPVSHMDIELDTPTMDVGEVQLSPMEDETLRQLFANNQELQNAQEAAGQGQQDQKQARLVRTASMRTVGTHPTAGVSQIGGSPASGGGGQDLSSIWNTAPDVREVFGLPTNQ